MNKDSSSQDLTGSASPNKSQQIGYIQTIISKRDAEKNFAKRKLLRDKGVIYPEFPKWTPTVDKSKEGLSPSKQGLKDTVGSSKSQTGGVKGDGPNLDLSNVRDGHDMTITTIDFHPQTSIEGTLNSPPAKKFSKVNFENMDKRPSAQIFDIPSMQESKDDIDKMGVFGAQ